MRRTIRALAPIVLLLSACSEDPRVIVRDASQLSATNVVSQELFKSTIDLSTFDGTIVATGFGLTLEAWVEAPEWGGTKLQATDVHWVGDRVFATYNTRDEQFLGALQVIDVSDPADPEVVAEAIYPITDLNRVRVAGDTIFTASADVEYGGTLERWRYDRETGLEYLGYTIVGSYSATFLDLDDYTAWVSVGDVDGRAAAYDLSDGAPALLDERPSFDARWVGHLEDGGVAIVSGQPSRIARHDASGTLETPVDGGRIGAPTWATRRGDQLFLSADDGGLIVYDLRDLSVIGRLETEGTANGLAIAPDGALAFLANGEEGLVVADVRDPRAPRALASIDVADDAGSANAADVSGPWIALADGLGGVKILRYDRDAVDPDDCDGDGVPNAEDRDDDDDGVLDDDDAAPCDPGTACPDGTIDYVGRFVGDFYNLPCDHPDVEGPVTGVVTGTNPWDFDWFDDTWYAFSIERDSLLIDYSQDYFPVDEGLCGDPFHFAVHWRTTIVVDTPGTYRVEMGSDDDSWLFVDGERIVDLGGVHALRRTAAEVELTAGPHDLEIWFAERHVVQSGLEFEFVGTPEGAFIDFREHVCLPPDGDADGDGVSNAEDVAPLTRPE